MLHTRSSWKIEFKTVVGRSFRNANQILIRGSLIRLA
jgi:hypothetical protein